MSDFIGFLIVCLIIWFVIAKIIGDKKNKALFKELRYECADYIVKRFKKYDKWIPFNGFSYLLIDDAKKIFKIETYANAFAGNIEINIPEEGKLQVGNQIDITRLEELFPRSYEQGIIKNDFLNNVNYKIGLTRENGMSIYNKKDIMEEIFTLCGEDKIDFNDLIKVDIVDKTTTNTARTFTMEGKTGDALLGGFLGDTLGGGNWGTIGAIAGASGSRQITQVDTFVNKNIEYDLILYLNRLNNNVIVMNIHSEGRLRELIGALQYIMHNKE